nr:PAS domain-containing protein [Desulfonatronospira sp.]
MMNAPVGIFTSTPAGRFLSVNPALSGMLGYDSPVELLDSVKDIATQVYADPREREELLHQLETRSQVKDFECRLVQKDGTKIWASKNVWVVGDEKVRVR